jgi:hypothetical protein
MGVFQHARFRSDFMLFAVSPFPLASMELSELVSGMSQRATMCTGEETCAMVCAFLAGFDLAEPAESEWVPRDLGRRYRVSNPEIPEEASGEDPHY